MSSREKSLPRETSKTQRKHAMTALQELGTELLQLSESQLAELTLPDSLADAIRQARSIKSHEARRRQLQYVGRLMRDVDPQPIIAKLEQWHRPQGAEVRLQREAERWREALMRSPEQAAELLPRYPQADVSRLRELAVQARWEQEHGRAPKAYRELFRALNALLHNHA